MRKVLVMADKSSPQTALPWTIEKMERHVAQRIRERIQISTMIQYEVNESGDKHHVLRVGGEDSLWVAIREAIYEAGWQVCR